MRFNQKKVNEIVAAERRSWQKKLSPKMPDHRGIGWYFWKFVHNTLVHPFLGFPYEPKWLQRAHDWTAKRCPGGG